MTSKMKAKSKKQTAKKVTKNAKVNAVKKPTAKKSTKKSVVIHDDQPTRLVFKASDSVLSRMELPDPCPISVELITGSGGILALTIANRTFHWNGVTGGLMAMDGGHDLVRKRDMEQVHEDWQKTQEAEAHDEPPTVTESSPEPLEEDTEVVKS